MKLLIENKNNTIQAIKTLEWNEIKNLKALEFFDLIKLNTEVGFDCFVNGCGNGTRNLVCEKIIFKVEKIK